MLNATAYRQQIAALGENVRWFKRLPSYDATHLASTAATAGKRYVEQVVPTSVKVLVREQHAEYNHPDFGLLQVGDLTVTCLSDQIRIGHEDELVFPNRWDVAREAVTRAASGNDELQQRFPKRLIAVSDETRSYVVGNTLAGDCYLDEGEVVWRSAAAHKPAAGGVYTIEYAYNVVYWYTTGRERAPRPIPGSIGLTPQQVILTRKLPGTA